MLNDIRPLRPPVMDFLLRPQPLSPRPASALSKDPFADILSLNKDPFSDKLSLDKDPFSDILSLDRLQPLRPLSAQPSRTDLTKDDRIKITNSESVSLPPPAVTSSSSRPTTTTARIEDEELTTTYKVINGFFVGTTKAPVNARTTTTASSSVPILSTATKSGDLASPGVGRSATGGFTVVVSAKAMWKCL